jgi:hypothetical protein
LIIDKVGEGRREKRESLLPTGGAHAILMKKHFESKSKLALLQIFLNYLYIICMPELPELITYSTVRNAIVSDEFSDDSCITAELTVNGLVPGLVINPCQVASK